MAMLFQAFACVLAFIATSSNAYIPASPTNDTSTLVAADDFIQINWLPMGTTAYKDALSRQLVNTAQPPVAGYRGALVHFTDANATTGSDAPWIALISCDDSTGTPSGSGATLQLDTISLAMRAGAETAILYSLDSQSCELDRSFVAGNNGTLDLYVTASQASAQSIIRQFMNTSPDAYWYNGTALDASLASIESQISSIGGVPTTGVEPSLFGPTGASSPGAAAPTGIVSGDGSNVGYLIATVANSGNSTNSTQITSQTQNNQGGGGGANTGLAMIILYAITGLVTLLFLVVILSGAIRAMRHPERYGPRARNTRPGDGGQSRIGGLSRAILDTFPVVKFLSGQKQGQAPGHPEESVNDGIENDRVKDLETGTIEEIELRQVQRNSEGMVTAAIPMQVVGTSRESNATTDREINEVAPSGAATASEGTHRPSSSLPEESSSSGHPEPSHEEDPGIEDEQVDTSVTCPICLVDFEDGDDLRVLPCDSRHQFHDACVVPWLLNVSSLCPLCRLDLAKDREPSGAETEGADGAGASSDRPPARPRASSVLASSFRHLLPTTVGSHRTSRQAVSHVGESPTAEAGTSDTRESGQSEVDESRQAGHQGATRSRWMRYVEQRRHRVRRVLPRRDQSFAAQSTER